MSRWSTAIRRKHWGFVSTRTKRTHGTSTDSSSIRSGSSFQILSVSVIYSEVRFVIYWFTCTWILPENLKYWSWRSVLLFVVTDLTLWTLNIKLLQTAGELCVWGGGTSNLWLLCFYVSCIFSSCTLPLRGGGRWKRDHFCSEPQNRPAVCGMIIKLL